MAETPLASAILQAAKYLIVDDEQSNIRVLERMLAKWQCAHIISTTNPSEVLRFYQDFQPDIILLDLMMPEMDGFDVMEQLKPLVPPEM